MDDDEIDSASMLLSKKIVDIVNSVVLVIKESYQSQISLQTKIDELDSMFHQIFKEESQDISRKNIIMLQNRVTNILKRINSVEQRLNNIEKMKNNKMHKKRQ